MGIDLTSVSGTGGLAALWRRSAFGERLEAAVEATRKAVDPAGKTLPSAGLAEGAPPPGGWGAVYGQLGAHHGVVYTDDISRLADLALADASRRLRSALAIGGVSREPPPEFRLDGRGGVVIDHPDAKAIADLLAADPQLETSVKDAIDLQQSAANWDRAAIFQSAHTDAYRQGGSGAAAALHSAFLSRVEPKVTLRLREAGLEVGFDGRSRAEHLAGLAKALGGRAVGRLADFRA